MGDEKPEIFVQMGHVGDITSVAISPDGKYALSGSGDKTLKLWDIASGREIRTFKCTVFSVAFSPDGRFALSGNDDATLTLWDIATGKEIRVFPGHTDEVNSVAISPDGKYALSGSEDKTIRLWDITTGKQIRTFEGILPFFSHDGRCILFTALDKTTKLCDRETGEVIKTFEGTLAVSDGRFALLGYPDNEDKPLQFLNIETREVTKTFKLEGRDHIRSAAFSPDGKYVLFGFKDYTIKLWDIKAGKVIRTFEYEGDHVSGQNIPVVFLPDGRYALSGLDEFLTLWDIQTGKEIRKFKGQFMGRVFSAAISPDGKYALLGCGYKKPLQLWDIEKGNVARIFDTQSNVHSVVFSADGKYVLSGSEDKTIRLWDIATGKEIRVFPGHTDEVNSVAISPDGKYALSGSCDKTLKLWDIETGKEIRTFQGYTDRVWSVAFSPDGKYALSGNDDATLTLWDIATGEEIRKFKGHQWAVTCVAFSPDGKYALSGNLDRTLKLWDIATGKQIWTSEGHIDWINSVAFSPDGRLAISGDRDGLTIIWDTTTGKEISMLVYFNMEEKAPDEWIIITPEGYFNASPNGAKHLNVRVGSNVYSIDNFYEKFFNPVYVASVLQGKKVETVADIRKGFATPPDVKITSPEPNTSFSTDTVTITVSAKDTGGGIDEIRLYHNGKAIGKDTRGVKIVPKGNEAIKTYTVTLVDGANTFRATAFSKDRTESNPYELIVKLAAPQKDVSMYIFAVGINKYKNPALNLNYAEPDAKGIVDFFKQKGKGLFKNVEIEESYNEQATKETIISKLNQLQNTNPQDVVLIYLAGHGENINDKWYFIPYELTYPEREEDVKTKAISSDELSGYIKNIKAQKILMLIDACKSGAVLIAFRGFEDRKALSQLSRSTGVHIVAASTKDQFASEVKELGHGVFTYILLEGLKGKAAGKGETVTVRKLMGYVEEKLPEITKKYKQEAQYPVVDSRGMDFPLVMGK